MAVAVITGASSGIGELTALRLAESGYDVVLTARREYPLMEVAEKCRNFGVQAVVVPADISTKEGVQRIAASAIQEFGSFDVWVNNAGVIMYGRFLDVSLDEFRKTLETNLFGVVYGSREALTQFRAQGHGTLINISSGYGAVPAPFASAYVTSKFAVRGLSASLREELIADNIRDIHVCTVLPGTINTPIYDSGGNKMEHNVRALPPVFAPEKVADAILELTRRPKAEVAVGSVVRVPIVLYALFPGAFTAFFSKYVAKLGFDRKHPSAGSSGNLFTPSTYTGVHGEWENHQHRIHKLLPLFSVLVLLFMLHKGKDESGHE